MQAEERVALARRLLQGMTPRSIALALKRSPSAISRKLARTSTYGAHISRCALASCYARRATARPTEKLDPDEPLWTLVTYMLGGLWSPQQIARILRTLWPDKSELHVSHETIYTGTYAHPIGELSEYLIECLRQGTNRRKPRSAGDDRRGPILEMFSIRLRPLEVNDRVIHGHRERDLIRGAGNKSSVGVWVERTARLVLFAKMPGATAELALAALTLKLNQIAEPIPQMQIYDRGQKLAQRRDLARATSMRVYFCDRHARGGAAAARTPTDC